MDRITIIFVIFETVGIIGGRQFPKRKANFLELTVVGSGVGMLWAKYTDGS